MNNGIFALLVLACSTSYSAVSDESHSKWESFVGVGLQSGSFLTTPESVRVTDEISPLLSLGTAYQWFSNDSIDLSTTLSLGYRSIDYSRFSYADNANLSHWRNLRSADIWETWIDEKITFNNQTSVSPFVSVGVGGVYTSSDVIDDAPYARIEGGLNFNIKPESSFSLSVGHYEKL